MHPIVRYRTAKGWTQTELAEQVGVSMTSVQSWERGVRPRPRHSHSMAALWVRRGIGFEVVSLASWPSPSLPIARALPSE